MPCWYSVEKIGAQVCPFWGPMAPTLKGMNNLGHWVGYRKRCDLVDDIAIRWTPEGGIATLPQLPGTSVSWATDINDSGVTVGFSGNHACTWPLAGGVVPLLPDAVGSAANAVNSSGAIVGWRVVAGSPLRYAFYWKDGVVTDIDPSLVGMTLAEATAVSNSGFVAGQMLGNGVEQLGFRWKDGVLEMLEGLPGGPYTEVWVKGVSDSGLVVGTTRHSELDGITNPQFFPTVWGADGQPAQLPLLPSYLHGACNSISRGGVILGGVSNPVDPELPITSRALWIDGVPNAIQPLIDAPSSQGFMPLLISETGMIGGQGLVTPPGGTGVWILHPQRPSADLDGDCVVGGADLALLLESWGSGRSVPSPADLDGDGIVAGADLGILLGSWGIER